MSRTSKISVPGALSFFPFPPLKLKIDSLRKSNLWKKTGKKKTKKKQWKQKKIKFSNFRISRQIFFSKTVHCEEKKIRFSCQILRYFSNLVFFPLSLFPSLYSPHKHNFFKDSWNIGVCIIFYLFIRMHYLSYFYPIRK